LASAAGRSVPRCWYGREQPLPLPLLQLCVGKVVVYNKLLLVNYGLNQNYATVA